MTWVNSNTYATVEPSFDYRANRLFSIIGTQRVGESQTDGAEYLLRIAIKVAGGEKSGGVEKIRNSEFGNPAHPSGHWA
jgi:hypothetical protein